jgi:hypothetical protein
MPEQDDFDQRMFDASQEVYDRITQGGVGDVEAAFMDAHLNASTDDQ